MKLTAKLTNAILYGQYVFALIFIACKVWGNSTLSFVADIILLFVVASSFLILNAFKSTLIFIRHRDIDGVVRKLEEIGFTVTRRNKKKITLRLRVNLVNRMRAVIRHNKKMITLEYPSKYDDLFNHYKKY